MAARLPEHLQGTGLQQPRHPGEPIRPGNLDFGGGPVGALHPRHPRADDGPILAGVEVPPLPIDIAVEMAAQIAGPRPVELHFQYDVAARLVTLHTRHRPRIGDPEDACEKLVGVFHRSPIRSKSEPVILHKSWENH